MISHRYWQQALAADPAVLGRSIDINGTLFTVIGVMPANFYGVDLNEEAPDMWLPITMQPQVTLQPSMLGRHGEFWLHMMARSNGSENGKQAQAWVNAAWQRNMIEREGTAISESRRKEIGGNFVFAAARRCGALASA